MILEDILYALRAASKIPESKLTYDKSLRVLFYDNNGKLYPLADVEIAAGKGLLTIYDSEKYPKEARKFLEQAEKFFEPSPGKYLSAFAGIGIEFHGNYFFDGTRIYALGPENAKAIPRDSKLEGLTEGIARYIAIAVSTPRTFLPKTVKTSEEEELKAKFTPLGRIIYESINNAVKVINDPRPRTIEEIVNASGEKIPTLAGFVHLTFVKDPMLRVYEAVFNAIVGYLSNEIQKAVKGKREDEKRDDIVRNVLAKYLSEGYDVSKITYANRKDFIQAIAAKMALRYTLKTPLVFELSDKLFAKISGLAIGSDREILANMALLDIALTYLFKTGAFDEDLSEGRKLSKNNAIIRAIKGYLNFEHAINDGYVLKIMRIDFSLENPPSSYNFIKRDLNRIDFGKLAIPVVRFGKRENTLFYVGRREGYRNDFAIAGKLKFSLDLTDSGFITKESDTVTNETNIVIWRPKSTSAMFEIQIFVRLPNGDIINNIAVNIPLEPGKTYVIVNPSNAKAERFAFTGYNYKLVQFNMGKFEVLEPDTLYYDKKPLELKTLLLGNIEAIYNFSAGIKE